MTKECFKRSPSHNLDVLTQVGFDSGPIYQKFDVFSTTLSRGDAVDFYYPIHDAGRAVSGLPSVIMLQGALVEKSYYSQYASLVARYGFIVAVPNHLRDVPPFYNAFLPEASEICTVFEAIKTLSANPNSDLFKLADTSKLALLGHSLGGAVGLSAIANCHNPLLCTDPSFKRPPELLAGVFYGANLRDPSSNQPIPIDNNSVAVALLQGNVDGVASVEHAKRTFEKIANPKKAFITFSGTNHFGLTNANNPSGARPDSSPAMIEQNISIEIIARWSSLFLRGVVLGDREALNYVFKIGARLDSYIDKVEIEDPYTSGALLT
ncbi:MAG: alpha/beta hydrolase [Cyanobacteria bacterium P01_H01_bin.15]